RGDVDLRAGQLFEIGRPALQRLGDLRAGEGDEIDRHSVEFTGLRLRSRCSSGKKGSKPCEVRLSFHEFLPVSFARFCQVSAVLANMIAAAAVLGQHERCCAESTPFWARTCCSSCAPWVMATRSRWWTPTIRRRRAPSG